MTTLRLVRRGVHALAVVPLTLDFLRWILTAGYRGAKNALRREGVADAGSILDLGCGTGAMAECFRPESYVGVDLDANYIEHARSTKSRYRFELGDGRSLPFADGSFDAVLINGVVHHLDDASAQGLLQEGKRVLEPGSGVLLMCEPIPARHRWNWIGRLIVRLDEGDFIRRPEAYVELVRRVFADATVRHYPVSSGVCDALVIVARSA